MAEPGPIPGGGYRLKDGSEVPPPARPGWCPCDLEKVQTREGLCRVCAGAILSAAWERSGWYEKWPWKTKDEVRMAAKKREAARERLKERNRRRKRGDRGPTRPTTPSRPMTTDEERQRHA